MFKILDSRWSGPYIYYMPLLKIEIHYFDIFFQDHSEFVDLELRVDVVNKKK